MGFEPRSSYTYVCAFYYYFILPPCERKVLMEWSKMKKLRGKYSWIGVDSRNGLQVLQIAEFRAALASRNLIEGTRHKNGDGLWKSSPFS